MTDKVVLPQWLDKYIYDELGANYCRSLTDMTVIDWNNEDVLTYLGTYFPRSYVEAYGIISQYLATDSSLVGKDYVNLFDFGCGTGGEAIGAITALIEAMPNLKGINIFALDGNSFALRTFEKILDKFQTQTNVEITYTVILLTIDDFYDLSILDSVFNKQFDIVMSFKAICEFVSKQCFVKSI